MQTDCYGFPATSEFYQKRALEPFRVKTDGVFVYACFRDESPTAIHRLENKGDGEWEQTWAWGDWNDAASLDYIPINETRDI